MIARSARGAILGTALLLLSTGSIHGEVTRGDINGDGLLDISDVILLFEWLSTSTTNEICYRAADVNVDGVIDFSDAVCILGYMYGTGDTEAKPFPEAILDACFDREEVLEMAEVEITVLTPESAAVSWLTAQPAGSFVRWATDESLTEGVEEKSIDDQVTWHEVLLDDLEPGVTYYYQAQSAFEGGNVVRSPVNRFTTLVIEPYTVRPDHPRIFITSEELPGMRESARNGGNEKSWDVVKAWCRDSMDQSLKELADKENVSARVRAFALVALLDGDADSRSKAISAARYLAANYNDKEVRDYTEAMAYVYDWLHDDLSSEARDEIRSGIVRNLNELDDRTNEDEYVTGTSHGNTKSMGLGSLAIHGEHERGDEILRQVVSHYRNGFLATWRRFAGSNGGSSKGWSYTSYTLPFETEFFSAWRSATGEDWFQKERVWCEPILDWFLYGLRGDLSFLREGDYSGFKGMIVENRIFGNMAGKEYGNANAQWLANRTHEADEVWGPFSAVDILWRDPTLKALPPSGPTCKLFRNVGVAIMRESLSLESSITSFRSAEVYTSGHTHRDNCSFTVYHKAPLALDTGIYDSFGTSHHDNYYSRTIAHNAITIFDPDETFVKYGEEFSNDGGQRWLDENDVPHPWPRHADLTVDRKHGYRLGGIRRHEVGQDYAYVVGDGSPSYSRRKLSKYYRHFLWLERVQGWNHPVIVVFDDVMGTRAEFKKTYHLHTEKEPQVDGSLVTVRNGKGLLYQVTLAPSDMEIEVIGGEGKEFWVNGKNYPPQSDYQPRDEPGAWRVEVSAPRERATDRFLHVLFIGEEDSPPPLETTNLSADGMQGCVVGNWTIFFDTDGPIRNVAYETFQPTSNHLLFGASPLAAYDIYLDGTYYKTVDASFSGTLTFDTHMAAQVQVTRQE